MGWWLLWLYHRFRFALLVTGILLENPFGYYAGRMVIFLLTFIVDPAHTKFPASNQGSPGPSVK